jgi:hypothetical protein
MGAGPAVAADATVVVVVTDDDDDDPDELEPDPAEPDQGEPAMPAMSAVLDAGAPVTPADVLAERGTPTGAVDVAARSPMVRVGREPLGYFAPGNPSLLRDIAAAVWDHDRAAGERLQRFQAMCQAGSVAAVAREAVMLRRLEAAPSTTVTDPDIVPPGYRPDLFTDLIAYEAPVWSAMAKAPISDFTPFNIPRVTARAGMSGKPADEVTPVPAGTLTTGQDTVTPEQVMGQYSFSRALAMSSNPAIDAIALHALNEGWLLDVEARAIAFLNTAANHTAAAATATTGTEYIKALRQNLAAFRVTRRSTATTIVAPGAVEWSAAVDADDLNDRPLLGWGQNVMNPVGEVTDAAGEANVLGVPFLPDGTSPLPANVTFMVRREDAVAFTTPMMQWRFEADATNPMVITLVKYSGVAFWTRRKEGVRVITNTGPITPLEAATASPSSSSKGK